MYCTKAAHPETPNVHHHYHPLPCLGWLIKSELVVRAVEVELGRAQQGPVLLVFGPGLRVGAEGIAVVHGPGGVEHGFKFEDADHLSSVSL